MKATRMFWGMLTMVGMLFATSCSQNELVDNSVDGGNYVSATFTLSSPEGGLGSRAEIGDGTKVNKVVCAIFDEKGAEMPDLREILAFESQTAKYSKRLAKGQNYRAVFFAYHAAEGSDDPKYYDITDLKNINIKEAVSNIEERDAFTNYVDIKEGETMQPIEKNVTLYRPFAQLNLGSYYDDWEAAVSAGVTIAQTKIVVSNVYTVFSAYEDKVEGDTKEVTFDLNQIPTEPLKADINGDGYEEQYKYLALNYLLVGDKANEKNLTDITFVWKNQDGSKTNHPVTEFKNIPVQRNYRTNIIGWLLTNPADFNITIDERFEKPDYNITAIDGTVFVEDVAEVLPNDGFMDLPQNVATIANKHITADGTAIVLNELPANAERGVLYIKNSTINAETFLEINGQFTIIIRNCHLNVETLLRNNTNRRDLQIHFEDCYVNGTPLTSNNKTEYIDVEDFGTVTARFNGTGDENQGGQGGTEGEGGEGGNTGNEGEGGEGGNTGNEGEGGSNQGGTTSSNVNMSTEMNNLGEVYNNQFFYIHDKNFGGTVTIDAKAYGDMYYFENVHFEDYIYIKESQTLIFDNCTFSKKGLVINKSGDTTVQIQSQYCTVNGEIIKTKDIKGSGW